jgi:hypothetical protein
MWVRNFLYSDEVIKVRKKLPKNVRNKNENVNIFNIMPES